MEVQRALSLALIGSGEKAIRERVRAQQGADGGERGVGFASIPARIGKS